MRSTRTSLRAAALALSLSAVTMLVGGGAAPSASVQPAEAASASKPNVILVVTDDQRLDELGKRAMPATERLIAGKGTTFTDAIVVTPTCCPSRATMLTGQYGHNNGVLANAPGYRGFDDPESTLPVWLKRAGYRTAHLGKYLNGYQGVANPDTEVAPGWDVWHTMLTPRRYYGYTLAVNGKRKKFGKGDRDHLTRVLNRYTARLIRRFSKRKDPFYIQLDQFAPHTEAGTSKRGIRCTGGAVPDPRDSDLFENAKPRKTPNFDEKNVSDKPSFIRDRDRLGTEGKRKAARRFGCRLASLRGVDRGVKKIVRTLKKEKELNDTVIMFTSDNGYFRGEHRIDLNKTFPYEEALRVPLAMRVPSGVLGGKRPGSAKKPVANVDLAPTILDLAGAEPCNEQGCRVMDGRSLVPLLRGGGKGFPAGRALALEYGRKRDKPGLLCEYAGVRDPTRVYIEYTGLAGGGGCKSIDEGELYDLRDDPFQLHSRFRRNPDPSGTQERLAAKLEELRDCSGIAGRDPQPAGGSYCE